jgi:branched-chain amino acid transport system substrate-binding protein
MKKIIIFLIIIILLISVGYYSLNYKQQKITGETETIKLGAVLALTGDLAAYGKQAKRGYDLALEEINSQNVQKIFIQYEDSEGKPKNAVSAFNKIILDNNIKTVIGFLSSFEVLSVAPIAETNKIILFSTGASNPQISEAGDYIFRNVPSDIYEAKLMAEYSFKELKKRKIVVIYNNGDYGIGVYEEFKKNFAKLGGEIIEKISYGAETKDFRTQISKIRNLPFDAIYLVGYKELGDIVKQLKELNISTQILSTALFEDNDILIKAGGAAEGVIFTSITFDPDTNDPRAIKFADAFKNKYSESPDGFAAVAYDAIYLLQEAYIKSNNNPTLIKEHLYKIKDFPGLLGTISFDENGDVILPIKVKIVKDNKFIINH